VDARSSSAGAAIVAADAPPDARGARAELLVRSREDPSTQKRRPVMSDRIRTVKSDLRELEAFAALTDGAARLLVPGLYTLADDYGRCPASPAFLIGAVFFVRHRTPNVIGQLLAELEAANLIKRYSAKGGSFLEIVGWSEKGSPTYQYIKKYHPKRYPAPPWFQTSSETATEATAKTSLDLDQDQRSGPGTGSRSLETELLAVLPPGPNGLKPSVGGLAAAAMVEKIETGKLTIEQCRDSVARFFAYRTEHTLEINGQQHLENALAKWITDEKKAPKKSEPKKASKEITTGGPIALLGDGAKVPRGQWALRHGKKLHVFIDRELQDTIPESHPDYTETVGGYEPIIIGEREVLVYLGPDAASFPNGRTLLEAREDLV
jgi:hypothetical protein